MNLKFYHIDFLISLHRICLNRYKHIKSATVHGENISQCFTYKITKYLIEILR